MKKRSILVVVFIISLGACGHPGQDEYRSLVTSAKVELDQLEELNTDHLTALEAALDRRDAVSELDMYLPVVDGVQDELKHIVGEMGECRMGQNVPHVDEISTSLGEAKDELGTHETAMRDAIDIVVVRDEAKRHHNVMAQILTKMRVAHQDLESDKADFGCSMRHEDGMGHGW